MSTCRSDAAASNVARCRGYPGSHAPPVISTWAAATSASSASVRVRYAGTRNPWRAAIPATIDSAATPRSYLDAGGGGMYRGCT